MFSGADICKPRCDIKFPEGTFTYTKYKPLYDVWQVNRLKCIQLSVLILVCTQLHASCFSSDLEVVPC